MKKCYRFLMVLLLCITGCSAGDNQGVALGAEPEYMEITVEDTVFEEKFYYEQLSEEEQLVYKEIYQGLIDCQTKITLHSNETEQVNNIILLVLMDFPEIFWTDGSGKLFSYNDEYIVLEPSYVYTGDEKTHRQKKIEEASKQIIETVTKQSSEYEKIKYIYEYLVESVAYEEEAPDNQNIYSSLVNGKSVCAGYAKANQYLLEAVGIPCIYVTGTASSQNGSDAHAWNIVKCDGKYYYVDVTWADAIWLNQDQYKSKEPIYDYLCCDEKTIEKTHDAEGDYNFPICDSSDLNYYRLQDMYYDEAERSMLLDAMYASIDAKEESIVFKFANENIYEDAKDMFINELIEVASQYLGEQYDLNEIRCGYENQDELYRFVIYWKYQ